MDKRNIEIINKLGFHARAAAKFVKLASSFGSEIQLSREDKTINGKSIMGVMMLAASKGTTVTLHVEGEDEQLAADQLEALITDRFGEAE